MKQIQILNEENAVRIVLKTLKNNINYKWDHINYINRNRYAIVKGSPNIAILLKRNTFMNFGAKFREFGESGVGDTINSEYLKEFIRKEVDMIYTIFPDGKIYMIKLNDFLVKSYQWIQKEGTEVRSTSIHNFKRVN